MRIKEWHRTIILLGLLVFAVAFLMWSEAQYSENFIDTFSTDIFFSV